MISRSCRCAPSRRRDAGGADVCPLGFGYIELLGSYDFLGVDVRPVDSFLHVASDVFPLINCPRSPFDRIGTSVRLHRHYKERCGLFNRERQWNNSTSGVHRFFLLRGTDIEFMMYGVPLKGGTPYRNSETQENHRLCRVHAFALARVLRRKSRIRRTPEPKAGGTPVSRSKSSMKRGRHRCRISPATRCGTPPTGRDRTRIPGSDASPWISGDGPRRSTTSHSSGSRCRTPTP